MDKPSSYKYCSVPMCKSTTIKTPNKIFFSYPRSEKERITWDITIKRNKQQQCSMKSRLYCCEDHFDVPEDMDNYMNYKLMKNTPVRLKKGVVPHIFEWQKREQLSSEEKNEALKRRRLQLVEEALAKYEKDQEDLANTPRFEEVYVCETESNENRNPKLCDKAVQVNIRPKFRSKAVGTKVSYRDVGTSPMKPSVKGATVPLILRKSSVKRATVPLILRKSKQLKKFDLKIDPESL